MTAFLPEGGRVCPVRSARLACARRMPRPLALPTSRGAEGLPGLRARLRGACARRWPSASVCTMQASELDLSRTCPGCGCKSIDDAGRCSRCGARKSPPPVKREAGASVRQTEGGACGAEVSAARGKPAAVSAHESSLFSQSARSVPSPSKVLSASGGSTRVGVPILHSRSVLGSPSSPLTHLPKTMGPIQLGGPHGAA